jgi:hypothetical protein
MKALRICLIIMFLFPGCKREDIPVVITSDVTSITRTSAICGGDVISQGDSEVNAKGTCWSITNNPTILDSITVDSFGLGSFTSKLTELDPGTEYYVRAYAKNSSGIGYGETKSFTTQPASVPELITIVYVHMQQTLSEQATATIHHLPHALISIQILLIQLP